MIVTLVVFLTAHLLRRDDVFASSEWFGVRVPRLSMPSYLALIAFVLARWLLWSAVTVKEADGRLIPHDVRAISFYCLPILR
jgi:hypothetical protein